MKLENTNFINKISVHLVTLAIFFTIKTFSCAKYAFLLDPEKRKLEQAEREKRKNIQNSFISNNL